MAIEAISPDSNLVEIDYSGYITTLSTVELFTDGMRRLGYMQTGRDKTIIIGENVIAYGTGGGGVVDGVILIYGDGMEGSSGILYEGI